MLDIWPTPALAKDIEKLDARLRETPDNLFDPDILTYPEKLQFFCARSTKPLVFLPVQNCLMLESLAVEPGATELEVAKSLEVLIKYIVGKALEHKYNEMYFLCRDPRVSAYAERHSFERLMSDEKLGVSLFRLKVGKLCA